MDDNLTPEYSAAGSIAFPDRCVSRITLSYTHNPEDAACGYLGQPHTQLSHQLPAHLFPPDPSQPHLALSPGYHSVTPLKPHAPTPKDNSHSSHYYLYASPPGVDPLHPFMPKKENYSWGYLLENKPATISRDETCGRHLLAGI